MNNTIPTEIKTMLDKGNYEQALIAGQESLKLTEEIGDRMGCVFILWQLGNIHKAIEQDHLAKEAWERGLEIAETFPDHPLQEKLEKLLDK